MPHEQNDSLYRHESDGSGAPQSALESAQSHLARSSGAGTAGDGGGTQFSSAFGALLEWGESRGLIREWSDLPFLHRPRTAFGQEHECWFDEEKGRWWKATYANRFGLAWGRDGSATAAEYLTRLLLQNVWFADSIELEALVNCDRKLRVLTSQPHIVGEPAEYDEIRRWFAALGFERLDIHDRIAWYRVEGNLLIADAHEGNLIKTEAGVLVPIDLNILQPNAAMLAEVQRFRVA